MTQMRSQTDEQLAAKWDPEPWLHASGKRAADELTGRLMLWGDWTHAPRPECIPSITFQQGSRGDSPIRTLKRPPVNPILVMVRAYRAERLTMKNPKAWGHVERKVEQYLAAIDRRDPLILASYNPEQIDHARKVLTRLAALA